MLQGERFTRMQCMLKCVDYFRLPGFTTFSFFTAALTLFSGERVLSRCCHREQLTTTSRASLCHTVHTPPVSIKWLVGSAGDPGQGGVIHSRRFRPRMAHLTARRRSGGGCG